MGACPAGSEPCGYSTEFLPVLRPAVRDFKNNQGDWTWIPDLEKHLAALSGISRINNKY